MKIFRVTYLQSLGLLFVLFFLSHLISSFFVSAQSNTVISLDSNQKFQTMVGWEASEQSGQDVCVGFDSYKDALFDQAVNDLGINRIRVHVPSGIENSQDYWQQFQSNSIPKETWRGNRYATVNDNADPNVINWSGFHFLGVDQNFQRIVIPLKQRLEARGEKLFINLNYVSFTKQNLAGTQYHHTNAEEYAEFALATFMHIKNKFGIIPDAWEMSLEPDNVSQHTTKWMNDVIVATEKRLRANSFNPYIIAPSTTDMGKSIVYFDALSAEAKSYVDEFSYHRYGGVSDANLISIGNRAKQNGIATSMLEHIKSGYEDLHKDLKLANNSAWQQYTLAFCTQDNGAQYYVVGSNGTVTLSNYAKFLRQYFKYIRAGAVRIGANLSSCSSSSLCTGSFDPLAFVNVDGRYVVVVKAATGGSFSIQGLPSGTYGIKYTTGNEFDKNLPDQANGGVLTTTIPSAGVITVYAKSGQNVPSTPTPQNQVCIGDINHDLQVGVQDLLIILSDWGSGAAKSDVDQDGSVSVQDLLSILSRWGKC